MGGSVLRVLVAEDGRFTIRMIERAVEQLGHVCETASDGFDAMQKLKRGGYQVLVTDWDMPRMDGVELCRLVRRAGLDGYTYVIMLTAHDRPEDMAVALEAGVDDFLTKPLQAVELSARLRVAERILSWESQIRAVNEALLQGTRELARVTQEIDNLRARAEEDAMHDALTGALNRRAWFGQVETQAHAALAIFDIDHFKRINDTFGHPVGDTVLAEVSRLISDALGEDGVVGRVGGEEFGVCFPGARTDAEAACLRAIAAVREARFAVAEGELRVTVSAGLADASVHLDGAYAAADRALYEAKRAGRDRLVVAREPREDAA